MSTSNGGTYRMEGVDDCLTVCELMSILAVCDPDAKVHIWGYARYNLNCITVFKGNNIVKLYAGSGGGACDTLLEEERG
jgi:hypothetical protein